jgi:hypothetical protein
MALSGKRATGRAILENRLIRFRLVFGNRIANSQFLQDDCPENALIKSTVLCVVALLITTFAYASASTPYIGKDLQMRVNGSAFFIRGMAYAPEPLGIPGNAMQTKSRYGWNYSQGAWLCGPANQYASNDWQSPCADDDLFGTLSLTTTANSAYNAAIQTN